MVAISSMLGDPLCTGVARLHNLATFIGLSMLEMYYPQEWQISSEKVFI
jgi:hypothetical protein